MGSSRPLTHVGVGHVDEAFDVVEEVGQVEEVAGETRARRHGLQPGGRGRCRAGGPGRRTAAPTGRPPSAEVEVWVSVPRLLVGGLSRLLSASAAPPGALWAARHRLPAAGVAGSGRRRGARGVVPGGVVVAAAAESTALAGLDLVKVMPVPAAAGRAARSARHVHEAGSPCPGGRSACSRPRSPAGVLGGIERCLRRVAALSWVATSSAAFDASSRCGAAEEQ